MVEIKDDEMLEIAFGGFVFRAPFTSFAADRETAVRVLAYTEEFDEEYLEELLSAALEGDERFAIVYRPGDALRRFEPSLTF